MVIKFLKYQKNLLVSLFKMKVLNNIEQVGLTTGFSVAFIFVLNIVSILQFTEGMITARQYATRLLITVIISVITILTWRGVKYSREILLTLLVSAVGHLVYEAGSVRAPSAILLVFIVAVSPIITNFRGLLITTFIALILVIWISSAEILGAIAYRSDPPIVVYSFTLFLAIILAASFATMVIKRYESYYTALKKSDQAIEQSPLTIVITNRQGTIEYVNPRFTEVTGYTRDEAIGQNPRILSSHTKGDDFYSDMYKTLENGEVWQGEFVNVRKDGRIYYEQSTICPIMDEENKITHYMALKEDITKRKEAEMGLVAAKEQLEIQVQEITNLKNRLQHQALHDPLTGLYNRRYLSEFIEREFDRISRAKQPLTLLVLDIDHFKSVNDTLGHRAGDQVLIAMAEFITANIRGFDICCRFGGEEFVVVMPGAVNEVAMARAEMLRKNISNMEVKFMDDPIHITVSIGVATYPDHGLTVDEILSHADVALYAAKRKGRNQIANWEPLMMLEDNSFDTGPLNIDEHSLE